MENTSHIRQITKNDPAPITYTENVFEFTISLKRPQKNIDFSFLRLENKLVVESYDPANYATITHMDISKDELAALVALFTQRSLIIHAPHVSHIDNAFESTICLHRPTKFVDFSYIKLEDRFVIESYNPVDYATITHMDISNDEREKLTTLFRLVASPRILNLVA